MGSWWHAFRVCTLGGSGRLGCALLAQADEEGLGACLGIPAMACSVQSVTLRMDALAELAPGSNLLSLP